MDLLGRGNRCTRGARREVAEHALARDGSTRDPRSFRRQRRDTGVARKPGPERVDGFFIVTERDDPLPWVRLANVAQPRGAGVVGVRRSLDGAKQIGGTSLMVVEGATELFQIW